MSDRWSQSKSKYQDLHGKVGDFSRKKTGNKDTQERGRLTTTNVPKKRQDGSFDELDRTMKAQNHGSPTQSKYCRPLTSPAKLKGIPIKIPEATLTILHSELPTSPAQRKPSSLDRVRASPSSRNSKSPSKTRTIESVSELAEIPTTFEELEALGYKQEQRLGGKQIIKRNIEGQQQLDEPTNGKKSRRDSSREDRHWKRDQQPLTTTSRVFIGPPRSDSEEDDDPFKDVTMLSTTSVERSKKTVSSGAVTLAGSSGYAKSTEHSKLTGANRPLSRTVTEKPRLLSEKSVVRAVTGGSRYHRDSEDIGSDDFQRDRSSRKKKDTSVGQVKSTSRALREEEKQRRSQGFFLELVSNEKPKDFFDMSKPPPPKSQERSGHATALLSNDRSQAKDKQQRQMENRDKAVQARSSRKIDRPSTSGVVELLDDDRDYLARPNPATKQTRGAQSSGDSESEKESTPKSRTKPNARSRASFLPMQAHAVASKDTSEQLPISSPSKKKDLTFTLPSPNKKKLCYESPSGYMSNQVIYMLSDDDIPRKVIEDDNVCPYCGDPLPEKKSLRLTKALAKIHAEQKRERERKQEKKKQQEHGFVPLSTDLMVLESPSKSIPRPRPKRREKKILDGENGKEDGDSDLRRRRESERSDFDPFGSPPPSSSLSSPPPKDNAKLSLMDRFEFCRVHIADEQIIPHGMEHGYPMVIDFPGLDARVKRMEPELRGIVSGAVPSPFLEKALSNYKRMGVIGARNPHFVLAGVQQTLPGYYGSKGSSELFKILARLFLESQFLTHEKANPQKPAEYIQHVLVPEAGVRLIAEDRNNFSGGDPISLEKAREIMMESVEFGSYVHDIELYA